MSDHNKRVISEFSRKADIYAQSEPLNDVEALNLLAKTARLGADDLVLDVACGPGVVSCFLAKTAKSVVGVDLTEAMLEQAASQQREAKLQNITWIRGDVTELPFPRATFSLVVSRYALHHVLEPTQVVHEMLRVCAPDGRIAIADVALPETPISDDFNAAERLRDPSHVRALFVREHEDLLTGAGLAIGSSAEYHVEYALNDLLEFSAASRDDKARISELLGGPVQPRGRDRPSPFLEVRDKQKFVRYPISIFVARRPNRCS